MEAGARAAAEEAIRSLGRREVPAARTAIAEAYELDNTLGGLADIVHLACSEIEEHDAVSTATWNTIADAVAHDPLLGVVEGVRTA